MNLLPAITALLLCQLAGTAIQAACKLPVPGAVIGMLILFALLLIRGRKDDEKHETGLGQSARLLLHYLPLMFVPAGVGVMTEFDLIARQWLPITASLLLSLIATIAFTGIVMQIGLKLTDHLRKKKP